MKLAFSSVVVRTVADFDHAVAQIRDIELLSATGIVLRLHSELWLAFMSADEAFFQNLLQQANAVAARAPGIEVFAMPDGHASADARVAYAARHAPRLLLSGDARIFLFKEITAELTNAIREQDLEKVIENSRTRCVICAPANHHFALPSGAHASQFLRLAEAFVDIEVVDRVAYWVALEICSKLDPMAAANETPLALVVDHPSMLILAARIQRLVDRQIELFTFPIYPSDLEARMATFSLLDRISSGHSHIFVLIGVASTGRLAKVISGWANAAGQGAPRPDVSTLILYGVQKIEGESILCDLKLPNYQHYSSATNCEQCQKQSTLVAIQSASLMLGVGPASDIALPPQYFDNQKVFLEKWGAFEGVLRVHYDDPNESTARHHAFYVDVNSLLDYKAFVDEMLVHAHTLEPRFDCIAVPDHPTAQRIGKLISESTRTPVVVLDKELLQGHRDDELLAEATGLLVVDDLFITGSRFDSINRFLRELGPKVARKIAHIQFFTLIATPPSDQHYTVRTNGMLRNHNWATKLSHLYKFPLPDWHKSENCPWCIERRALEQIAQAGNSLDNILSDRLSDLGLTTPGLTANAIFLSPEDTQLPTLGAQSALMHQGATPLQVLFTCASAFQQLRYASGSKPLDATLFPSPTVVAERVFSANYSERLIWLGLIRALRSNELSANLKIYLKQAVLNAVDHQRTLILAELAVAWLTGKLGSIEATLPVEALFNELGIEWDALLKTGVVDTHPFHPPMALRD
jgi:hypothetical protein